MKKISIWTDLNQRYVLESIFGWIWTYLRSILCFRNHGPCLRSFCLTCKLIITTTTLATLQLYQPNWTFKNTKQQKVDVVFCTRWRYLPRSANGLLGVLFSLPRGKRLYYIGNMINIKESPCHHILQNTCLEVRLSPVFYEPLNIHKAWHRSVVLILVTVLSLRNTVSIFPQNTKKLPQNTPMYFCLHLFQFGVKLLFYTRNCNADCRFSTYIVFVKSWRASSCQDFGSTRFNHTKM